MKVFFVIAQENFRDEEYQVPKQILEENGIQVTTASITTEEARGMLGARVKPETTVADCDPNDYQALVMAGGSGSPKLADYPEVLSLVRRFHEQGKPIAAICLAGYVLARTGIIKGTTATVYPADFALAEYRKAGVNYSDKHVVKDGKIITADGPEAAREFALKIVQLLKS